MYLPSPLRLYVAKILIRISNHLTPREEEPIHLALGNPADACLITLLLKIPFKIRYIGPTASHFSNILARSTPIPSLNCFLLHQLFPEHAVRTEVRCDSAHVRSAARPRSHSGNHHYRSGPHTRSQSSLHTAERRGFPESMLKWIDSQHYNHDQRLSLGKFVRALHVYPDRHTMKYLKRKEEKRETMWFRWIWTV
ncbi:hypothetical protein NMY22_g10939 [Coprinellus aureogranulatus]|nr:hypothetical protein NMY22_g10939 [Coprinellus aureogranulatus]